MINDYSNFSLSMKPSLILVWLWPDELTNWLSSSAHHGLQQLLLGYLSTKQQIS
jgi:hypothetical protein